MNEQEINFALIEHGAGMHKPSEAKSLQGVCYECYKINKHNEKVEDYRLTNHLAGMEN